MKKLVIPAKNFRKFDDPFVDQECATGTVKYRFYAHVADVPAELLEWMETNPRDQNLNTDTAKAIARSLRNDSVPFFHLWNRGILLSADRVVFDNRSGNVEIYLDDPSVHGNIDGGHTLRTIIECQKDVKNSVLEKMPNQYVELEVLTGLDSPVDLAEARNTSVAVDLKTMEELKKSYDVLKSILEPCYIGGDHYIERIEFHQNQMRQRKEKNPIDIREVISIINMFNQKLYPNTEMLCGHPIQSFSGKEVGLKKFLQAGLDKDVSDEECRIERDRLMQQMAPIIPDIFILWDTIECHFTDATSQLGKRYGRKKYANFGNENPTVSLFSNTELEYAVPRGIIYPLLGAFRALVQVDANGTYSWVAPPIAVWEEMKESLASAVMTASDEQRNVPTNIGKSQSLWSSLFSSLYVYSLQKRVSNSLK